MAPERERADICYFSGTGNTEYVAGLIAEELGRRDIPVGLTNIGDVLQGRRDFSVSAEGLLAIGHPIHAFGAPALVYEFVRRLPEVRGRKTFIFTTAGAESYVNNGASKTIMRLLRKKGYDVFYEDMISMPSNFFRGYSDVRSRQLCGSASQKAGVLADAIAQGKRRILRIDPFTRMVMKGIELSEHFGARIFGRSLHASEACTSCRKCVQECPAGNITSGKTGRIRFGWKCNFCMRCIYSCPARAISPRLMRFCVIRGGYNVREFTG